MYIEGYYWQPDTPYQKILYQYVRDLAQLPSEEAIRRLSLLLVQANTLTDRTAKNALDQVVGDPAFGRQGIFVINRIFFTICNLWHLDSRRVHALRELIVTLETIPLENAHGKTKRELHRALRSYREGELYQALKQQMKLLETDLEAENQKPPQVFADCFPRYFFLYVPTIQTPDIQDVNRYGQENLISGVEDMQLKQLRQLSRDLKGFWRAASGESDQTVVNPTMLSDQELKQAIQTFDPTLNREWSRHAEDFQQRCLDVPNMAAYREVVQDHVMRPFCGQSSPGLHWFKQEIANNLASVGESHVPVSPMLEILPFQRLISRICCYDEQHPNGDYFRFWLEAEPGLLTSLFLNMVMACKMARFELEKRLASLYHKFADASGQFMNRLVGFFEHMNVALALNARSLGYYPPA